MRLGLIGLGRMDANMSRRWLRAGQAVVGYARTASTVERLVADGARPVARPWRPSVDAERSERREVLLDVADLVPVRWAAETFVNVQQHRWSTGGRRRWPQLA